MKIVPAPIKLPVIPSQDASDLVRRGDDSKTDTSTLTERRSARVILLNAAGDVLLIRFAVERAGKPFAFWATPGGAIEEGESERNAARRELREELGLDFPLEGPVHRTESEFEFDGARIHSVDFFFLGRCQIVAPALRSATEAERKAMKEIRWWSAAELAGTTATVFPIGLAELIQTLGRRDIVQVPT